jgi:predicted RNA-binding Zn-ribbon protein involved in translation (DUF1610 family)
VNGAQNELEMDSAGVFRFAEVMSRFALLQFQLLQELQGSAQFYPTYKMTDRPPTPVSTLERAYEIGKESGLDYVYTGNIPGHKGENTYCPACGKNIIDRMGFQIAEQHIIEGKCEFCGHEIAGQF